MKKINLNMYLIKIKIGGYVMNHLIIYAHPSTNSFSNAIANAVKQFSIEQQYKTELRDLYSIGFDPLLKASELEGIRSDKIPEDVKREQNYIEWADIITFIYPLWWTGMPAILKGYIDRVFFYGMAYTDGKNRIKGLLKDKQVYIFTPMGTAENVYSNNGMIDALKQTCDTGIFSFCGMKVKQHIFIGEVPTVKDETRTQYLDCIIQLLSKTLGSNDNKENSKEGKNQCSDTNSEDNNRGKDNSNNLCSNQNNSQHGNGSRNQKNNGGKDNNNLCNNQNNNQHGNGSRRQGNNEGKDNKSNLCSNENNSQHGNGSRNQGSNRGENSKNNLCNDIEKSNINNQNNNEQKITKVTKIINR